MKKPESFNKDCSQIAKGIAIIMMLIHHLFYEEAVLTEMNVKTFLLSKEQLLNFAVFGKNTVAIFVIISAYGLSKAVFNDEGTAKDIFDKSLKRFFKLMANFAVLYFSIIVIFGKFMDLQSLYGDFPQGIVTMFVDATGFAEAIGSPTLNQTWWYMELAYVLIFLVPILAYGMKKIGYSVLPIMFFLPVIFTMSYTSHWFFFSAAIGVAACYGDWFNKLLGIKKHYAVKCIVAVTLIVFAYFLRTNPLVEMYLITEVDAILGLIIIWVCAEILSAIPGLREGLAFIGKNSLNIFLVHTFFYLIFLRKFVYRFEYAIVTLLVLLVLSLAYSVALEYIKKFVVKGYAKIRGKKESHNE